MMNNSVFSQINEFKYSIIQILNNNIQNIVTIFLHSQLIIAVSSCQDYVRLVRNNAYGKSF